MPPQKKRTTATRAKPANSAAIAQTPGALEPARLRYRCDPAQFSFETSADLPPLDSFLGQARAVEAVHFGIGMRQAGYNMFALGPSGTGKQSVLHRFIAERAAHDPAPSDLCYVHNFAEAHRPQALILPAGRGAPFRHDMENMISLLKVALVATFAGDDYRARRHSIDEQLEGRQKQIFDALQAEARTKQIALVRTPDGLSLVPLRDDALMPPDEFKKLPDEERKRFQADIDALQEKLEAALHKLPEGERVRRDQVRELNRAVADAVIAPMISDMQSCYDRIVSVTEWLRQARADLLDNIEDFLKAPGGEDDETEETDAPPDARRSGAAPSLRRYRVNLLVDNAAAKGAPLVYEDNPNLQSLLGRIEYIPRYGMPLTDHSLLKPGALHRANGGYLLIDARKLLLAPFAWEELKRALKSRMLRIDSTSQVTSVVAPISLEPEAIPLDVKIVLLGDRVLYYLLSEHDPDFRDLFKVAVDFADAMDRTPETLQLYARLIADIARHKRLRPLDRGAMARVVEHAARLADDSEKLTAHIRSLVDILCEADLWAGERGADVVAADDIETAIAMRARRADRVRELSYEQIVRETLVIGTDGAAIGQVNGLSVLQLGDFAFGKPARITARARVGLGDVVDIEREVALGGPLHSKGVLILAAFLAARYLPEMPLSLHASLVFEQSYGGVDGDSASSAELYALMSALAEVPLGQNFAVTGSVDQMGNVQAIGGVNEKIEGFFDICAARGLSGAQGVLVPAANVKHLMLRRDVVAAAKAKRFHVYSIATIDQGIALLTGREAGARGRGGKFPATSVNGLIEAKLALYARRSLESLRRGAAAPRPARRR
ncbi:MAG: Lon protease family protein [Alphaproteobacteria bacterium]